MTAIAPPGAKAPTIDRPTPDVQRARGAAVDLLCSSALALIAGVGFHTSFGGWRFIWSVVAGAVLGALLAELARRTNWPGVLVAAVGIVVFFTLGAMATIWAETASGLPTAQSLASMLHGATDGWARLLTLIPPAGHEGNLLVVPFEATFLAAATGGLLAGRRRSVALPVLPGAMALILSVLWGTSVPAALLIQGCGFAVVACAWMAERNGRRRTVLTDSGGRLRLVWAAGMLIVAVAVASVGGTSLPFRRAQRYVLRDVTQPPFDPSAFPSPLARYPYYTDKSKETTTLFRVEAPVPLPVGTWFRLAAMDAYDGQVFKVNTVGHGVSGLFVKVSSSLPGTPPGPHTSMTITIKDLSDVWLPLTGRPAVIEAAGSASRALVLQDALRFNQLDRALVLPTGTHLDDRYHLVTVLDTGDRAALARSRPVDTGLMGPPPPPETPAFLRDLARQIVDAKKATTPFDKAQALADALQQDGIARPELPSTHSIYRLELFLDQYRKDRQGDLRGTGEQYAATMAIMARMLDLPARVVVGFQPHDGLNAFDVHGKDVRAWVEVAFQGVGWVRFNPVPDKSEKPVPPTVGTPKASETLPPEPPPAAVPPPPTIVPADESMTKTTVPKGHPSAFHLGPAAKVGLWLLSIPVGAAASIGVIMLAKRRRRSRRKQGDPDARVRGAWMEYLDQATDMGRPVPPFVTRREAGLLVGGNAAAALSARTDALIFGGADVTDRDAEQHWKDVDRALGELVAGTGRLKRIQARANLQTFIERPGPRKQPRGLPHRKARDAATP